MSTTPTIVVFKTALISALQARTNIVDQEVQVEYVWPGPDAEAEMISLLGEATGESQITSVKAAPMHRQEDYTVTVVVWTFNGEPETTAPEVEGRAIELWTEVEGALREDPQVTTAVSWAGVSNWTLVTTPYQAGYASQIEAGIAVKSRLT